MEKNSTEVAPLFAGDAWFEPIETELRERVRSQRGAAAGYRNGTRTRRLLGSFGPVEIAVPRARLSAADGRGSVSRERDGGEHDLAGMGLFVRGPSNSPTGTT